MLPATEDGYILGALELATRSCWRRRDAAASSTLCCAAWSWVFPTRGSPRSSTSWPARARAKAGKHPGVTRGPKWVRLADGIELLDTAGIMLPGRLEPASLLSLAVTGTIKEEVLPLQELAPGLAELIQARGFAPRAFGNRPPPPEGTSSHEWLQALCRAQGFLLPGGELDERRAVLFLLKALRDGRWGPLTLERPEEDGPAAPRRR